ncbi:hypothetical protein V1512DRAFT_247229 [Lipomyces arxii]|uniref:uncharacterized protein n=1 Tax=Lipomyces arxii TaxID=56418 RepID=UPI0034CF756C
MLPYNYPLPSPGLQGYSPRVMYPLPTGGYILQQSVPVLPEHVDQISLKLGLNNAQISVLEQAFKDNGRPNIAIRDAIADKISVTTRVVQLWFQDRRKRAKDEKQQEAVRVERILAAATESNTPTSSQSEQHEVVTINDEADSSAKLLRPSTPPQSRPSSASPIKTTADQYSQPPSTPLSTPNRPQLTTPIQQRSQELKSPIYASPSEASYASLERSLAVAEAAAASRVYPRSPYTVMTPGGGGGGNGGYFLSPSQPIHSPLFMPPGTPVGPGGVQALASPYLPPAPSPVQYHGHQHSHSMGSPYVMSPVPLQRTYSNPGSLPESPVHLSPGDSPFHLQRQSQLFSPLATTTSESSLAARRRRQGPLAVRLRRSQSYTTNITEGIPSAPPYIMSFQAPMVAAQDHNIVAQTDCVETGPPDPDSTAMRRSKSVSFVQSQSPLRTRKLSLCHNNLQFVSARNSPAMQTQDVDQTLSGTPSYFTARSYAEIDEQDDAGRGHKRMRSRKLESRPDREISTDEDEPQTSAATTLSSQRPLGPSLTLSVPSGTLSFQNSPVMTPSNASPISTRSLPTVTPEIGLSTPPMTSNSSTQQGLYIGSPDPYETTTQNDHNGDTIDPDLASLEQNQRLMMLTRQLDDMGIFGYSALQDIL